MSRRSIYSLALATSVLVPLAAHAVPLSAVAKAEARYELLLVGGTFTANVPSIAHDATVISIGDVIGASLATPALNCLVPGSFCIFGGNATATAIANDGHIRVEAGVGPFSVDFSIATPGLLTVNALIEDTFTLISPIPPGGAADAKATIADFTLIGLGGGSIEFAVDPDDPESFALPIGSYTLVWQGLETLAEAEQHEGRVPAPASLALFGVALAGISLARRRGGSSRPSAR